MWSYANSRCWQVLMYTKMAFHNPVFDLFCCGLNPTEWMSPYLCKIWYLFLLIRTNICSWKGLLKYQHARKRDKKMQLSASFYHTKVLNEMNVMPIGSLLPFEFCCTFSWEEQKEITEDKIFFIAKIYFNCHFCSTQKTLNCGHTILSEAGLARLCTQRMPWQRQIMYSLDGVY